MAKVHIQCGTWNVNAKTPGDLKPSLRNWLCKSAKAPDLVAVSLQEIVGLSDVTQYIQTKCTEDAAEVWAKAFVQALEGHKPYGSEKYMLVANAHMVGTMTCLLAKAQHISSSISEVMIGYFACGHFGMMGNKGGVGIRLRLRTSSHKDKTLCFVGSHLSAHQNEVSKRNADFAVIMDGMTFHNVDSSLSGPYLSRAAEPLEDIVGVKSLEDSGRGISDSARSGRSSITLSSLTSVYKASKRASTFPLFGSASVSLPRWRKKERDADFSDKDALVEASVGMQTRLLKIDNHDLVFWFGDLNYRIDGTTWQEALKQIQHNDLQVLIDRDQLRAERNGERCFQDFYEGELHFKPTYKFRPGTSKYDQRENGDDAKKKVRVPAWCDRILWQCNGHNASNQVQQCSYYSCPEFVISDHKPVGAEFVLPLLELSNSLTIKSEHNLGIGNHMSQAAGECSSGSLFSASSSSSLPCDVRPRGQQPLLQHRFCHWSGSSSSEAVERISMRQMSQVDQDAQIVDDALRAASSFSTDQGSVVPPKSMSMTKQVSLVQSVCAVRDFNGHHPDELSFRDGDLITIFTAEKIAINDSYLLGGRMDGKIGYFRNEDVHPMGAVKRTITAADRRNALKVTAMRFNRIKHQLRKSGNKQSQQLQQGDGTDEKQLKFIVNMFARMHKLADKNASAIWNEKTRSEKYLQTQPAIEKMVAAKDYTAAAADEFSCEKGDEFLVHFVRPIADDTVLG